MRFTPPSRLQLAFLPYVLVGLLHLAALVADTMGLDAAALVLATKPLLMPTLLLGFLLGVPSVRARAVLFGTAAIVLSWLGDLALMLPGTDMFLLGLVAFLSAHVFFVLLIARYLTVRRLPLASLAYVGWWIALIALLAPHVSWMVWPLAAYGIVLGLMAVFATRAPAAVVVGGLLFLISDSVLAVTRFMPAFELWASDVVIMATYIIGQGLIAAGAMLHLRRRHADASAGASGQRSAAPSVVPVMHADAGR